MKNYDKGVDSMFIYKLVNKRLDLKGLYTSNNLIDWYNSYYGKNEVDIEVVFYEIKKDSDFSIDILGFFDCVEI